MGILKISHDAPCIHACKNEVIIEQMISNVRSLCKPLNKVLFLCIHLFFANFS